MIAKYTPPLFYRNAHLSTIIPNLLRRIHVSKATRVTVDTPDGDFIDIDRFGTDSQIAAILLHGLEGSSQSTYMKGMTHALLNAGVDVMCMNQRGCSGRPNQRFRSYHSGNTEDLRTLISALDGYTSLFIIGFSLGGNIILKYLSEPRVDDRIRASVAISVPVHLESSAFELHKSYNRVYLHRFLKQLKRKAIEKTITFPEHSSMRSAIVQAKNFFDFDNAYTAPAHGFSDAIDYYEKASSIYGLHEISLPTLIINAQNDSFLANKCYPYAEVEENSMLQMLVPTFGGHVGFASDHWMRQTFWHEQQTIRFIKTQLT